tara:strand:+ start:156 stop:344 length:189 start_codon:yes stop_codon:yes gene_type:complete
MKTPLFIANKKLIGFRKDSSFWKFCKVLIFMMLIFIKEGFLPKICLILPPFKKLRFYDDYKL